MRYVLLISLVGLWSAPAATAQSSLQVLDPQQGWRTQQGTIEEAVVSVRPQGAYLEYGLYLTFSGRESGLSSTRPLEIEYFFDLPEGAIVTDSWLWVGDEIMQALIFDRWTASQVYEGIVNRRRDPSILYQRSETRYELRVYPLMLGETRKVKITYLVPADLLGGAATAALPLELLEASRISLKQLEVLAWNDGTWGTPLLLGSSGGTDFEFREVGPLGPHYHRLLQGSDLASTGVLSVAIPIPFRDGVFFAATSEAEGGYYQSIVQPAAFLPGDGPRHVVMLIDHDAANASLSGQAVLEAAKLALQASLTDRDFFNLFVSRLQVQQYATDWMPATTSAIEAAFAATGPPADYTALPALLQDAIAFGKASATPPTLVLVSASDAFSTSAVADQLLRDLRFGEFGGSVQVVDYQDRNIGYYRVNGLWYRGNGYLYDRLTQASGGSLTQLDHASELATGLRTMVAAGVRDLTAIDLDLDLGAGYSYDRFTNVTAGASRAVSEPVVQTGRYLGTPPFQVSFSGSRRGTPFSATVDVSPETVVDVGDGLRLAWVGQRIQELGAQSQTTAVINETIELSLAHRILTQYTAFLALEPSDTTKACADCQDETQLTWTEPDPDVPAADSLLQIYPNPVHEYARVRVSLPLEPNRGTASLALFDLLGRQVRSFELNGTGVQTLSWDRRANDGSRLASGVYILSLRSRGRVSSVQVVVI